MLDLFSGIGGFSLGLERSGGFETVAFCEIDPFCRKVLVKHWPKVPCYDDIRSLTADRLAADGIAVDAICGGFPCQDISNAGKRAGMDGERSGLWSEYARLIGELRPRYVIVENVAALLGRGLDRVLGDLAALGFDAEWHCIPASAVGAPHRRDRLWVVANSNAPERWPVGGPCDGVDRTVSVPQWPEGPSGPSASRKALADADNQRQQQPQGRISEVRGWPGNGGPLLADPDAGDEHRRGGTLQMGWGRFARQIADDGDAGGTQWGAEPNVGRVAHGVSSRVDRLSGLGNAVVPQIPELIGRAIMAAQARAA